MSTFIKMLPIEMALIKDYHEPSMEMEDSDHVVGDMSEDLKKLWTLLEETKYRAAELQVKYVKRYILDCIS